MKIKNPMRITAGVIVLVILSQMVYAGSDEVIVAFKLWNQDECNRVFSASNFKDNGRSMVAPCGIGTDESMRLRTPDSGEESGCCCIKGTKPIRDIGGGSGLAIGCERIGKNGPLVRGTGEYNTRLAEDDLCSKRYSHSRVCSKSEKEDKDKFLEIIKAENKEIACCCPNGWEEKNGRKVCRDYSPNGKNAGSCPDMFPGSVDCNADDADQTQKFNEILLSEGSKTKLKSRGLECCCRENEEIIDDDGDGYSDSCGIINANFACKEPKEVAVLLRGMGCLAGRGNKEFPVVIPYKKGAQHGSVICGGDVYTVNGKVRWKSAAGRVGKPLLYLIPYVNVAVLAGDIGQIVWEHTTDKSPEELAQMSKEDRLEYLSKVKCEKWDVTDLALLPAVYKQTIKPRRQWVKYGKPLNKLFKKAGTDPLEDDKFKEAIKYAKGIGDDAVEEVQMRQVDRVLKKANQKLYDEFRESLQAGHTDAERVKKLNELLKEVDGLSDKYSTSKELARANLLFSGLESDIVLSPSQMEEIWKKVKKKKKYSFKEAVAEVTHKSKSEVKDMLDKLNVKNKDIKSKLRKAKTPQEAIEVFKNNGMSNVIIEDLQKTVHLLGTPGSAQSAGGAASGLQRMLKISESELSSTKKASQIGKGLLSDMKNGVMEKGMKGLRAGGEFLEKAAVPLTIADSLWQGIRSGTMPVLWVYYTPGGTGKGGLYAEAISSTPFTLHGFKNTGKPKKPDEWVQVSVIDKIPFKFEKEGRIIHNYKMVSPPAGVEGRVYECQGCAIRENALRCDKCLRVSDNLDVKATKTSKGRKSSGAQMSVGSIKL